MSEDDGSDGGSSYGEAFYEYGEDKPQVPTYTFPKVIDLPEDFPKPILEQVYNLIEKHSEKGRECCEMIKELLDANVNPGWQVVIGGQYGFSISHDDKQIIYMFTNGSTGILIWRCTAV